MTSTSNQRPNRLGILTHGSLQKGFEMKLDHEISVEQLRAGQFVVIEGTGYDFFSLITDMSLAASNEGILLHPPARDDEFLRQVLHGSGTYVTVNLKPMLMMPNQHHAEFESDKIQRVKTVPAHYSVISEASEEDVARIFGSEHNGNGEFFEIGKPLDMDVPVCLNLDRIIERSNAVFGKTGTGKTFLTRLLLAGTIKYGKSVNLIFDMHSEYAFSTRKESNSDAIDMVPGLKNIFPNKVSVFSLDRKSTSNRGKVDVEVFLYADQILPADILPLRDTLNLNATAEESAFLLYQKYKKYWLKSLMDAETKEEQENLADEIGAHPGSLAAFRRKMSRLANNDFFSFEKSAGKKDVLDQLQENLQHGISVILEFGKYQSLAVYMLVSNVITRRLRVLYEEKTNLFYSTQNEADLPKPLMITIEEAHKFLNPQIAKETPFGNIAREMRKFFISLLIVDQRPSAIDEEVLSQIGTKLVAQLSDEKDIAAAVVGMSDSSTLRQILTTLDSKQQLMILGHAIPMPMVIKSRNYDQVFFDAMNEKSKDIVKDVDNLFG